MEQHNLHNYLNVDFHLYWASLFQNIVNDIIIFHHQVTNVNDKFPLPTVFTVLS